MAIATRHTLANSAVPDLQINIFKKKKIKSDFLYVLEDSELI